MEPGDEDIQEVLAHRSMLLPSVVPETGPFAGMTSRWIGGEPPKGTGRRSAAVGFYLALVTAQCLDLIGHEGPVIVEGPFARNKAFLMMLGAASASPVIPTASSTGTSQGAALLLAAPGVQKSRMPPPTIRDEESEGLFVNYAAGWNATVKGF